MRSDFVGVAPEDTLGEVAQKMVDAKTGSAAVLDYGRLIGILTERDMLKAMAGRVLTSDARAREWMTADPITAAPDTPLEEAQATMLENGFRHLPVMEDGELVGIVSMRALASG
jgi:CBS domain-containing protein